MRRTGIAGDTNLLESRCYVSGIIQTNEPGYSPGALVPNVRARARPTEGALFPFMADNTVPDTCQVEIIRLNPLVKDYIQANGAESYLGKTHCDPNQLTTTVNERMGVREGLHFDDHETLPVGQRAQSKRRMGLNVGPGARYLLIGSIDVFDFAEQQKADEAFWPKTSTFREQGVLGETACLWVELLPGDGYIAPTENILHDGSTYGQELPSTIGFWLGSWRSGQFSA